MKNYQKGIVVAFVALTTFFSCTKEKTDPIVGLETNDCQDSVKYQATIAPIIMNNCSTTGCHDVSNAGGYVLLNYTQISSNATLILRTISHETGVSPMPKNQAKLNANAIQNFDCWIKQGKLDN